MSASKLSRNSIKFFSLSKLNEFNENETAGQTSEVDWTPEMGYPHNIKNSSTIPRPAAGGGRHLGLFIVMNVSANDYYCSSTNSAGVKVLLHNPIETPNIANYGFSLTPGFETRINIIPRFTSASNHIRQVPLEQRQCVFANEIELKYFR